MNGAVSLSYRDFAANDGVAALSYQARLFLRWAA